MHVTHFCRVTSKATSFVGCSTFWKHASVSQGRICMNNCTCCHTDTQVADQTWYLTQSQYTDTGLTSPSSDLMTRGTWQDSHQRTDFVEVTGMTACKKPSGKRGGWGGGSIPGPPLSEPRLRQILSQAGFARVGSYQCSKLALQWLPCQAPGIATGFFRGRVIPVTSKLALQWLPCQAPGVVGSVLGLDGPVSVYCDWLR